MTAILAIETATDACSVAVYRGGEYRQCHEQLPRQHAQRLFPMLREVLDGLSPSEAEIDALAYGCGPGSFTGLRICASAVQGLAYAANIPAVPVSTLECQVATALRTGKVDGSRPVLSTIDARIGEIYWSVFTVEKGNTRIQTGPFAGPVNEVLIPDHYGPLDAVGSGCKDFHELADEIRIRLNTVDDTVLPEARDLISLALPALEAGAGQSPAEVMPVYVRDEISWKKLSEQGKSA